MAEAGNYYVVTLHGDRGPMNRKVMVEQLRAGEIAGADHVRNAFGRPLGTVAEVLGADAPRGPGVPHSSGRLPTRRPVPAPAAVPSGPAPLLIVVVSLFLLAAGGLAYFLMSDSPPPAPTPTPTPVPVVPPRVAPTAPGIPAPPPKVAEPPQPGLLAELFKLDFKPERIPIMSPVIKPDWNGVSSDVSTALCEKAGCTENVYARWQGKIDIAKSGTYTFFLTSDDGSRLTIDGTVVVNNDGPHGMQEQSGRRELSAGRHPIRIDFFQGNGGYGLIVQWQPEGSAKEALPSTILWH